MSHTSIEYAHIYTNQNISEEHELSVSLLREFMANDPNQDTASLVVMIDDYSFPDPSFSYTEFSDWLKEQNFKPDLMVRESQLIPECDLVVSLIENESLKKQITDYIKIKKYPCSLFIATWYLLRLGKIDSTYFPKELVADRLLNILPDSFKPFEDKGLEIISATQFNECVNKIGYNFISGRLIA